jgi:branched-chain amino acid transport system substrate-binding protein
VDDALLSAYAHKTTFKTIVGDVTFGSDGSWTASRVLTTQFRGIAGNDIEQFKSTVTEAVVSPRGGASPDLIYPYENAKPKERT